MQTSPKLGLNLPEMSDVIDITKITANFNILDKAVLVEGSQTIAGNKTFTGNISRKGAGTLVGTATAGNFGAIQWVDATDYPVSDISTYQDSSGTNRLDITVKDPTTKAWASRFKVMTSLTGVKWSESDYRSYSSAGNNDVLVKGHIGSITDLVHTTGNEDVFGHKVFFGDYLPHSVASAGALAWVRLASIENTTGSGTSQNSNVFELLESWRNESISTNIGRMCIVTKNGSSTAYWMDTSGNFNSNRLFDTSRFKVIFKSSNNTTELWYHCVHSYWSCSCRVVNANQRNLAYMVDHIDMTTVRVDGDFVEVGTDVPIQPPRYGYWAYSELSGYGCLLKSNVGEIGELVHTTGNENVGGFKKFTYGDLGVNTYDRSISEHTGQGNGGGFSIYDKNGDKISAIYNECTPSTSASAIYSINKATDNSTVLSVIKTVASSDKTVYGVSSYRNYANAGSTDIITKGHIANISDLVHTTGNENIAGDKNFKDNIIMSGNLKAIQYSLPRNRSGDRATETLGGITFDSKDHQYVGGFLTRWYDNGSHRINMEIKGEAGDTKQLNLYALPDGTAYGECPYRAYANAGNTEILVKGHVPDMIASIGGVKLTDLSIASTYRQRFVINYPNMKSGDFIHIRGDYKPPAGATTYYTYALLYVNMFGGINQIIWDNGGLGSYQSGYPKFTYSNNQLIIEVGDSKYNFECWTNVMVKLTG